MVLTSKGSVARRWIECFGELTDELNRREKVDDVRMRNQEMQRSVKEGVRTSNKDKDWKGG